MKNYMTTVDPLFDQLFGYKTMESRVMPTNIIETKDNYVIEMELPDVKKEDLKVSLKDGELTVSIKKNEEALDEEATYLLKERKAGEYSRSFKVGDNVKFDHISAKLNNGVLTLTIKKVEEVEEEKFVSIE